MNVQDIIDIALTVLASLGGGAAIVFISSNWLGKVWANRIMAEEMAKYERELTELRAKLEKANEESLSRLRMDLDIYRDTYLKTHNDKLTIYRLVTDIVSEFLADMDMVRLGQKPEGNVVDRFNRNRLRAHGYLAMLAPQNVLDAWDALVDFLFTILEKYPSSNPSEDWKEMRRRVYILINVVRVDVGIDKNTVEYRGKR